MLLLFVLLVSLWSTLFLWISPAAAPRSTQPYAAVRCRTLQYATVRCCTLQYATVRGQMA